MSILSGKIIINNQRIESLISILFILFFLIYSYLGSMPRVILSGAVLGLSILQGVKGYKKNTKDPLLIREALLVVFIIIRNTDIALGLYGRVLYTIVPLLFILVMSNKTNWYNTSNKLMIFCSVCSFFISLFPSLRNTLDLTLLILLEYMMGYVLTNILLKNQLIISSVAFIIIAIEFFLIGKLAYIIFSLCAALVLININLARKNTYRTLFTVGVICILIYTVFYFSIEGYSEIGVQYNKLLYNDSISNGRAYLFKKALEYFERSRLLGIGWGGFHNTLKLYSTGGILYEVHNVYLQLLCEVGIIGMIIFTLFFIMNIIQTYKAIVYVRDIGEFQDLHLLYISIYMQIFFIFYGISGNFLYDLGFVIYAYEVAISWSLSKKYNIFNQYKFRHYSMNF